MEKKTLSYRFLLKCRDDEHLLATAARFAPCVFLRRGVFYTPDSLEVSR